MPKWFGPALVISGLMVVFSGLRVFETKHQTTEGQ